jgi:glycosyltransferase involved in cell wall biosynthesis
MRVGVDATPLLGPRTGIGNYTAALLAELPAALGPGAEVVATAFTLRGFGSLAHHLPPGITDAARPAPARLVRAVWKRSDLLDVRRLTGPVDVVHGTNFVLPPARDAGGVLTIHDLTYLRWPQTVAAASLDYPQLVQRAVSRGAVVCTPSAAVADQVCDAYAVPRDRVHATPLGIAQPWLASEPPTPGQRAELGIPAEYLVAVGTLEPRKNLNLLLDCYRLAAARRIALPPLVLVGGQGWGRPLQTAGVGESSLTLTGHLDEDALRRVVAGALGLLFPSLDEGFGLPPLEALACGVPAVVSDIPVTHEVLGDQARYADPRDAESFLEAILTALSGAAGTPESRRARAATFTWKACADATVAAYRQSLG